MSLQENKTNENLSICDIQISEVSIGTISYQASIVMNAGKKILIEKNVC